MTEQQFRKAWGLDAPQHLLEVDMDAVPKMTGEEFFQQLVNTPYSIGFDPISKDGKAAMSTLFTLEGLPINEQVKKIAAYYGSQVLRESEQPLEGMAQALNLRRRFMLGELLTDEELLILNRY